MKEFPVSETAMIRLKAMVGPILYAVALRQLEADSIDPFPVVEFMFAGLLTPRHSVKVHCKCYLNKNLIKPFMTPPSRR